MTRSTLTLLAATILLYLTLILSAIPSEPLRWAHQVPIELPIVLAMLCLLGRVGRIGVTVVLSLLAIQKMADIAMQSALGRPFNAAADLPLIDASFRLSAGSFGVFAATGTAIAAMLAATCICAGLWWATGTWSRRDWSSAARMTAVAVGALAAALAFFGISDPWNGRYVAERLDVAQQTLADLRDLRKTAARDPFTDRTDILSAVDRDILLIFVESYGRTSFDTPFYANAHLPTLRRAEAQLAKVGLASRSGFLQAPTQGGQSWLSHSTFANGLWISDQSRFRAMEASGRKSLFHYAMGAGFQTIAVMPAIVRPWPEAQTMGFDRVLTAGDLGYRGKPFNWVTMPDQFTLAAVERLLHEGDDRPRLFVQIALISSHAPWTPVPHMLPWQDLGDGTEFDTMAVAGDPSSVVWRDRERVKRHYRDAIDYSLQAVFEFAARQGRDAPLMFILGDHQAAPSIAMDDRPDVALHVIGPPDLVERAAKWRFAPGLIPPPDSQAMPMDRMRDLILGDFVSADAPV